LAEPVLDQPEQAEDPADIVDILVMVPLEQVAAAPVDMPAMAEMAACGTAQTARQAPVAVEVALLVAQDNILAEAAVLDYLDKVLTESAAYGLQITHAEAVVDLMAVLVLLLR
jgi:hypothetical protein